MYGFKNGILQNIPQSAYLQAGESAIGYDELVNSNPEIAIAEGWSEIQQGYIPAELGIQN